MTDLASGRTTPESLAVSLAAPRLRRERVPIGTVLDDPERRLFELLERAEGDLAHARYSELMHELARTAPAGEWFRVYIVGGGTAVLEGWRVSTIVRPSTGAADRHRFIDRLGGIEFFN